jgi:hypothetical protein
LGVRASSIATAYDSNVNAVDRNVNAAASGGRFIGREARAKDGVNRENYLDGKNPVAIAKQW